MIEAYYGLGGGPAQTMEEMGESFGLSKQRVAQLLHRGLECMRQAARACR